MRSRGWRIPRPRQPGARSLQQDGRATPGVPGLGRRLWGLAALTIAQGRVALTSGDDIDDPKSQARRRSINVEDIHPGSLTLLRSMKTQQAADRLQVGQAWQESGLIVVNAIGVPVRPEYYSDRFRALSVAAEVPVIRLHSVRHSLAKMLHAGGISPADAAALLGHTVDVYLRTYLPASGSIGVNLAARTLGTALATQA